MNEACLTITHIAIPGYSIHSGQGNSPEKRCLAGLLLVNLHDKLGIGVQARKWDGNEASNRSILAHPLYNSFLALFLQNLDCYNFWLHLQQMSQLDKLYFLLL